MCGICGMVGRPDKELVRKMTAALQHRGPDDEGYFIDTNAGLGIRRLSIIDLQTGAQPIYNEDKSLAVVLNGEIYNYKELAGGLRDKGHKFYTNSDTEVLVHLYEELGEDCIHKLRGMFAFAIWDKRKEELFLARDRLGIKPLYYSHQGNRFIFASEIKALLKDQAISREIDLSALDYYLTFLYIPAPLTIFKNIKKLLPGHSLKIKDNSINIKRYWRLNALQESRLSINAYKQETYNYLKDAVQSHLVSDVPLGVFLSGGIDSSAIVALMSKSGVSDIKTFSIGYEGKYASYNELEYASIIAKKFNTEHQEFIIKPDIINTLGSVVKSLDEPFADSSAILTYFISKEASRYVKVALSGIGGDEVFGGYPRYLGALMSSYYDKTPYFLRSWLKSISSRVKSSSKSRNVSGWIKRFLEAGLLTPQARYLSWISYFSNQMKQGLYSPDLAEEAGLTKDYIHMDCFKESGINDYLDRVVYMDINTYLPDDLLIMADRMSMANSLELRVPFCDHKLVEKAFSVSYSQKLRGLRLKGLLRDMLNGILPSRILNKPKQGFMIPLADWLREDLKLYSLEILCEENIKKRGYFNSDYVQRILNSHFSGKATFTHQIWALLILELWLREYSDNK
ncbi:MAG: asparagine synthase (glutamine-hydrolyzing) [Candidatus Omnitrophota bacterium]